MLAPGRVNSGEEALGSKTRKGRLGRKANGGYKVIYNDYEQQIIHVEAKDPKLCNLLKDEINHLLSKDCPTEIPVFGMLIGGHNIGVRHGFSLYTHELVDKSSKQCLEFLMKAATPGTLLAQMQLYVQSFRSPKKKFK
ncbi:hypothetical protein AB4K20DRAFT_1866808 [Rhizopus microsporus]|uniref:Uncharacterized protein n=1 Tax=Rhizopus microsporus TaxID=58291 RepID=A0A1X0S501_RHIZD|nr:hypothetical protein BCV71DRAFT_254899 [Rhizopus microsporus]